MCDFCTSHHLRYSVSKSHDSSVSIVIAFSFDGLSYVPGRYGGFFRHYCCRSEPLSNGFRVRSSGRAKLTAHMFKIYTKPYFHYPIRRCDSLHKVIVTSVLCLKFALISVCVFCRQEIAGWGGVGGV